MRTVLLLSRTELQHDLRLSVQFYLSFEFQRTDNFRFKTLCVERLRKSFGPEAIFMSRLLCMSFKLVRR